MRGIKVTVQDLTSGETSTVEVPRGEYLLLTTTPCYLAGTQVYPKSGTHVLTIKGRISTARAAKP